MASLDSIKQNNLESKINALIGVFWFILQKVLTKKKQ